MRSSRSGAAALEVAEDDGAGFDSGLAFDDLGDGSADAAEPGVAERTGFEVEKDGIGVSGALGDHDDRVVLEWGAVVFEDREEMGGVDRNLGDEDVVGADGHTGEAGDPAGATAHSFDDDDAAVAFGCGSEAFDGFDDDVDGRVKAEREVGEFQVVVDRLGDADDGEVEVVDEADGDAERVVAANHDEGVEFQSGEVAAEQRNVGIGVLIGVGAGRAEDGPPLADEGIGLGDGEGSSVAANQPAPAFRTPTHSPPALAIRRTTARITALRPGQSPPPVSRPTFMGAASIRGKATPGSPSHGIEPVYSPHCFAIPSVGGAIIAAYHGGWAEASATDSTTTGVHLTGCGKFNNDPTEG